MKAFAAVLLGLGLMATTPAIGGALEPLQWKKRVLLVFHGADDAGWREQRAQLAGRGAAERDLLVLGVPGQGSVDVEGVGAVDASTLRRDYGVAEKAPLTVLLVGKDGGVKERQSKPIAAEQLFATIDAMPMRVDEARRRN